MTAIFRNKNLRWAKSVIDNMQRDYQEGLPIYLQNKMRKKEVSVEAFNDVKTFFNEFSSSSVKSVGDSCPPYIVRETVLMSAGCRVVTDPSFNINILTPLAVGG